jgi:maleylpyruvate isomerase
MNQLDRDVEGAAAAHQQLLARVDGFTDDDVRAASLLPGWTVAHVLAHLVGNGDSFVRIIAAANRGEVTDQYPGGAPWRAEEIDELSTLPAVALVDRLRRSIWSLEQAWATCTAEAWQGSGRGVAGIVPVADLPFRRRRETLVHHADLGRDFTWRDWPADYVRRELGILTALWASRRPMGLTTLPDAALAVPEAHRVAWLLGRADIDGLDAAGVYA